MGRGIDIPDVGVEFGRPDIERLGFFVEMGYLVGKKYSPQLFHSDIRDLKGRQLFPGYPKWKTGLQDCYFEPEFKRIFEGEGYPRKRNDDESDKKGKKKAAEGPVKPFVPSKYPNPLYHRGDAYGYFSYSDAFSPKAKPKGKRVKEPRGIYTSPGKLGNTGYVDICLNPYPEHLEDKYTPKVKPPKQKGTKKAPLRSGQPGGYFDPNPFVVTEPLPPYRKTKLVYQGKVGPTFRPTSPAKWDGGCKEGTFEKFPEYKEDRYNDPFKIDKVLAKIRDKKKPPAKGKGRVNPTFKPPTCCKTWQSPSVMARKAEINTHADNWTQMRPITFTEKVVSA